MRGNSPEKSLDQVLGVLSVEKAKEFLMDSLNLPWAVTYPDHRDTFNVWLRRWQRVFTFRIEEEDGNRQTKVITREQLEQFAPKLRTALRKAWYERDPRQRDWYFYRLRDEYHSMIVRAENPHLIDLTAPNAVKQLLQLEELAKVRGDDAIQRTRLFERMEGADLFEDVPRICPFEAAVYWLQINQNLMVYCEGPVCPAPYFFRSEKGQKYCSHECADPARKQAKLNWWNENRKNQVKKK